MPGRPGLAVSVPPRGPGGPAGLAPPQPAFAFHAPEAPPQPSFSFNPPRLFPFGPESPTSPKFPFGLEPSTSSPSKSESTTAARVASLPGNEECADCEARSPTWASTNHGVVLCIECAGVHRSLGVHVSCVRSLELDEWRPDEVERFIAKGGNTAVNTELMTSGAPSRIPADAPRQLRERHITAKYGGVVAASAQADDALASGAVASSTSPQAAACFSGIAFVDVLSVELSESRTRDLRLLGALGLSLSVRLTIGGRSAAPTPSRGGSATAVWDPPERIQIPWDPTEDLLLCEVFDEGHLGLESQLAGAGNVDLREAADVGPMGVNVDLWPPIEEEGAEDAETPCGVAHLRVELVDLMEKLGASR